MGTNRKRVGIYLDYSIRIPAFVESYTTFKDFLFKDTNEITSDEESMPDVDPIRFYWKNQLEDVAIMNFYIKKSLPKKNYDVRGNFQEYFFNEAHCKKFLEEYSFNLYSNCEVTSKKDISIINICQTSLFDVYLFDRVDNTRKVSNTLYFLSKNGIFTKSITFLGMTEEINKEDFLDIWDPVSNKDQINKDGSDVFLNWFKDLETKNK